MRSNRVDESLRKIKNLPTSDILKQHAYGNDKDIDADTDTDTDSDARVWVAAPADQQT